jgi:glutamyl-tRNA synthetase
VKITVKNSPEQTIQTLLHPDFADRGKRTFKTNTDFYITKDDSAVIKAKNLYRLKDCLNFKKEGKEYLFDSTDYDIYHKNGEATFHWLPVKGDMVETEVLMPDKKLKKGFAEAGIKDLPVGTMVQFERFGFCRLDSKTKDKIGFWFAHK